MSAKTQTGSSRASEGTTPQAIIEARDLKKVYGRRGVVRKTFEIGTGDVRPYNLSPNLAGESRNPVPIS